MSLLPAVLYAGTLFEAEKRTSDPYVGEKGGFNSLMVNPAGTAGQSGFELSANVGARSKTSDLQFLTGMYNAASSMGALDGGVPTADTVGDGGQVLSELYSDGIVSDALLDSLFDGTALDPSSVDWSDPAAVEAAADTLSAGDISTIEGKAEGIADGTNTDFFDALPGSISINAVASAKIGFIIKGFGLGVYDHAAAVALMDSSGTFGLESVYNELGVVAGGGANFFKGKLALGVSGNYGVLTKNQDAIGFDDMGALASGAINFGYTWGIDIGAVWRPTPALGVGIVFNDVVGYTEADLPYESSGGYEELFATQAYLMDSLEYEVTFDIDAGITWQPDWKFVQPKFSFDMYDIVSYGQDVAEYDDDFEEAMYRALAHMRFGANFTFFQFLKIGTMYYDNYISAGIGLDLLFLEIYADFKVSDQVFYVGWDDAPLGADLMVRIHF